MATATAPAVTSSSQAKLVFFVVFFALTVLVVYDKDARVFDPTSPIAQHFAPVKWYVLVHGFFAAVAMAVAAFQFSNRLRALSPRASYAWVYVRNQRLHWGSTCGRGCNESVALTFAVRRQLRELIRMGPDHTDCALLCSQWQHHPAPALDDPQLPLGNDVYFQSLPQLTPAQHALRTPRFRSKAMVICRTGGIPADHFSGMACDIPTC